MQCSFLRLRSFPSFCHKHHGRKFRPVITEVYRASIYLASLKCGTSVSVNCVMNFTSNVIKKAATISSTTSNTIYTRHTGSRVRIKEEISTMDKMQIGLIPDRIRRISEILLNSLSKRYPDNFVVPWAKGQGLQETDFSSLSTRDIIYSINNFSKSASMKTEELRLVEHFLLKQLYKLPLSHILLACHGFFNQHHDSSVFLSHVFSVVEETFDSLAPSPYEITFLMLFIFVHGNAPSMLFYKVEEYLLQHLEEFDINNLGVICIGFFRGKYRMSSQDLLDGIGEKLLKDVNKLDTFLLLDFLKMFRHASYIKVSFYDRLADHIVSSNLLSKFNSVNQVMHLAFTYASVSMKHPALFQALLARMEALLINRQNSRTKDISKFVWACGSLQFMPENFVERYRNLANIFKSNSTDSMSYPESCAELLMGLAYLGIFPENLLTQCFSSSNASKLLGSGDEKEKTIQLLLLSESVKAECPQYRGNTLSQNQVAEIMQHPSAERNLEQDKQTRVGLKAVLATLQQYLGPDKVQCLYPLLHFKTPVIELRYCPDAGGFLCHLSASETVATQTVISDHLLQFLFNNSMPKSDKTPVQNKSYKRVVILVTSSNQYALNDPSHELGHLHMMKRQLNKSGCTLIEVNPEMAAELELGSVEERCQYLSHLLSSSLLATITLS